MLKFMLFSIEELPAVVALEEEHNEAADVALELVVVADEAQHHLSHSAVDFNTEAELSQQAVDSIFPLEDEVVRLPSTAPRCREIFVPAVTMSHRGWEINLLTSITAPKSARTMTWRPA